MTVIDITALTIIAILALLMLLKRGKKTSDWYLTIIFMLMVFIYPLELIAPYHILGFAFIALITLLFGPITYFHIRYLITNEKPKYLKIHLIIPFILVPAVLLPAHIISDEYLENYYQIVDHLNLLFIFIALLFYAFSMISYYKEIKLQHTNIAKNDLSWIRVVITVYMVFTIINFAYLYLNNDAEVYWIAETLDSVLMLIIIVTLAYFGYRYGIIYPKPQEEVVATIAETKEDDSKWLALYEQIDNLIKGEQLYLDPLLKIEDIAKRLTTNGRYVSQAINSVYGDSATNYLNDLRLSLFKEKLLEKGNQHLNIDVLWQECGFNSKSSFNRFFKKREGMTPSEYRLKQ